jgi:hypothetical protein
MHIRVGWFLNESSPGISIHFKVKILERGGKKILRSHLACGKVLSVGHLIKVSKFFFRTQSCHTSKDREFNLDFTNINLP